MQETAVETSLHNSEADSGAYFSSRSTGTCKGWTFCQCTKTQKLESQGWDSCSGGEPFPNMHETQGSIPSTASGADLLPQFWGSKGKKIRSSRLPSAIFELETSLGFVYSWLKNNKQKLLNLNFRQITNDFFFQYICSKNHLKFIYIFGILVV